MADIELNLQTSAELNGETKDSNDRGYKSLSSPPIDSQNSPKVSSNIKADDQTEFEDLVTKLITRNYEVILFCVCFSIGIGFIIYLFSGRDYWIWGLAIVGLIVGLIVDQLWFGAENVTRYQIEKEKEAAHDLQWKPYEYAQVLCKSELIHPRTHHVRNKNWVLTNNQTLIFHKEASARIEGYHGWEIGASISSFFGFIVTFFTALGKLLPAVDPDAGDILAQVGIIILVTIVLGIIGALIEKYLRHMNILYPTHVNVEHEIAVPLYEIGHFEYTRLGYYFVYRNNISIMLVERLALRWFKVLVWIIKGIYKIIQFFFYACYINPFFILFLLITGTLAFLYAAHIGKDKTWIGGAIILAWITFVTCTIIAWFFSSHYKGRGSSFTIAGRNITKIDEVRMPASTIKWFFRNLITVLIILLITASLISFVFDSFYKIKLPVVQIGNKNAWFRDLTCQDPSGTSGNTNGAFISKDADFCKDSIYNSMVASLVLLTLLWFWTLASSLMFYLKDKRSKVITVKDEDKDNKQWIQYINFTIYRSPYVQSYGHYPTLHNFLSFFLTPFFMLFNISGFNNHMFPVNVELTPEDAHKLSQYLVQNVQLYNGKYANANINANGNVNNNNNNNNNNNVSPQRQYY